jgi:hypothetical protein
MRTRRVTMLAALLALLFVLGTTEARANSYPGLVEQWYSHGSDSLRARIAIEVNSSGEGRFRFHLTCFYTDDSGNQSHQYCDFRSADATWCDLTTAICASRTLGYVSHDDDYTWVGFYRTLVNNHTYAAKVSSFSAYFYNSGYGGTQHTLCTKEVTWHTGGSPTIGGAACSAT